MILIMPCLPSNSVWMTTCSNPFLVRILRNVEENQAKSWIRKKKEEQLQDLLTDKFEGNMAQKIQSHLADSQFSLKVFGQ